MEVTMASEQQTKIRRKRSEWAGHLAAWKQSGLGQDEYCKSNNLDPCSFSSWKNKLEQNERSSPFVEIMHSIHQPANRADEVIELTLEGVRIRLREDIDPIKLRNIVIALMGV
jgi:hypothetical protein